MYVLDHNSRSYSTNWMEVDWWIHLTARKHEAGMQVSFNEEKFPISLDDSQFPQWRQNKLFLFFCNLTDIFISAYKFLQKVIQELDHSCIPDNFGLLVHLNIHCTIHNFTCAKKEKDNSSIYNSYLQIIPSTSSTKFIYPTTIFLPRTISIWPPISPIPTLYTLK